MALPDPTTVSGPVGARLTVPTHVSPEGGQTTHPSIVSVPETLGGYTYWMAHTPYPGGDDEYEDPNIVASNDGVSWVVPAGLVNPIDNQPGSPGAYNSDVDLRMGPDDTLYLFWRTFDPAAVGAEENLYVSTSIDGATWSAKALIYSSDMTVRRLLSPCFLYEGGAWTMWAVDIVPSPNQAVKLQGGALPTDAWGAPVGVDMGPMQDGKEPWHLGLIAVDDGYLGLLTDCIQDVSGVGGDLLFITSPDGLTWTNSLTTVIPRDAPGEYDSLYRATLLPDVVNGVTGWRVWYSAWQNVSPSVWNIFRTFVAAPVVAPPIDPVAPDVGVAVEQPIVEWIACELVSGDKIAYLQGVEGTISRALGAYTSDTLTVPAPLTGPLAMQGLLHQSIWPDQLPTVMVVCVVNDLPQWGGIVWKVRGGTDARIELGCATLESYLDRRYIGEHTFTQVDQATIVGTLGQAVNVEGIDLEIDAPLSGTLRDREYHDDEDATYYTRLTELMDVDGGPEWTIDLDWKTSTKQGIRKILRVRDRIGSTTPRGPLATQSKAVTHYGVTYDYGKDRGANDVLAYSSGEGVVRPQSQHIRNTIAIESGVPRVEHRWSPSSSIKSTTVLNSHATSALYRLDGGTTSLAVTSRWNVAPARLGIDLDLGDDISYSLVGHMHPTGLNGTARMVGYRLDPLAGTFEPVLRT